LYAAEQRIRENAFRRKEYSGTESAEAEMSGMPLTLLVRRRRLYFSFAFAFEKPQRIFLFK
jgi:hypothetical protein